MRIFIYVTTVFISLSAFSQQNQFIQYYGEECVEMGLSVLNTNDGGYILTGFTEDYNAVVQDIIVIKTDSVGQVIWQELYGGLHRDFGQYMIETHDHGYIIAGFTNSYGMGQYDAYLVKIDSSGGFEWQNTFGGSDYEYAYCVNQTSENGYLICGSTMSFGNGARDGFLTKTDSAGNEIWTKYYGGTNNDGLYRLINDGDSIYYLCGYTYSYGSGSDDVFVIKTDTAGNIIWQKTFGTSNNERGMSISKSHNNLWIGAYSNGFGNNQETWVLKCNTSGILLKDTLFGGSQNDIPFELETADNGDILITGETNSFGNGGTDVYLLRIDTNFNKIWETSFGGTLDESGYSIKPTPDAGCIITGQTYSFNITLADIYLIKTNALGEATSIRDFSVPSNPISIYPNPARDFINLKSKSPIEKYVIYDINGKALYQSIPLSKNIEIAINNLVNGIYFIEITTDKNVFTRKFIKQ